MATILVVDDSPIVRRKIEFTLQKNGHTVLVASHGREALERLAATPVDMVITDVSMPEMDGLELIRCLRAEIASHTLPIVVLTASGQVKDRLAARDEGANGFLTKPTSSWELLETIERFVPSQS